MHGIQTRLFLVLAGTGVLLVLIVALLFQIGSARSLQGYLEDRQQRWLGEFSERLIEFYNINDGWQGSSAEAPLYGRARHLVLLDDQRQLVQGDPEQLDQMQLLPLTLQGENVGWLGYGARASAFRDGIDQSFRQQQGRLLLFSTLLALVIALLVSWLMARYLVRPIHAVAGLSRELISGNYQARLDTRRRDELGELSRDINQLASTLSAAACARDRWLADISHELRTPLTILQGEIEALVDGVRQPEPARLCALHQEIDHLGRLVDDLHDLALADAGTLRYRMESLDLAELIDEQARLFSPAFAERQINFSWHTNGPLNLLGDTTRLRQLLSNLLANSQRYTDPGGSSVLQAWRDKGQLHLTLEDSAPGVSEEDLPRIFDHLFRAESASRNRDQGGAGLGLALCKRIVEAHQGTIHASASSLGGLTITISFGAGQ